MYASILISTLAVDMVVQSSDCCKQIDFMKQALITCKTNKD